jgi:hypothetical protein
MAIPPSSGTPPSYKEQGYYKHMLKINREFLMGCQGIYTRRVVPMPSAAFLALAKYGGFAYA